MRFTPLMIAVLIVTACAKAPVTADDPGAQPPNSSAPGLSGNQETDWSAILKLEGEAKGIAKTAGCTSSDCKSAPVGSKACGGPRDYLPYCAKTTDSAALYRKLDEVATSEKAYNRKYNLASTCEFRMPPTVEAVGGVCTAK